MAVPWLVIIRWLGFRPSQRFLWSEYPRYFREGVHAQFRSANDRRRRKLLLISGLAVKQCSPSRGLRLASLRYPYPSDDRRPGGTKPYGFCKLQYSISRFRIRKVVDKSGNYTKEIFRKLDALSQRYAEILR
jgi:hypothetical protein